MKSTLVLIVLALLSSTHITLAQLTFTTPSRSAVGTSTAVTATNGKIVTVTSGADYAWIISDLLTASNYIPQEYFVTLICATNVVDFGFQTVAGSVAFDTTRKLLGDTSSMDTDKASVYYPNQPTGGTTTPIYIATPGTTLRWTATRYTSQTYIELRIRDMANTHVVNTPINSGGTTTAPSNTNFQYSYAYAFGFEVLNCGQAKFCVQTAAEAAVASGNCDAGATTASSCAASACTSCDPNVACATCAGTKTTCATCPSPLVLYNGQCLFTCPAGFLTYNNICYSNCPAGSFQSSTTECTACDGTCAQCSGTATSCVVCSSGTPFLYNGRCYANCPSGTYNTSQTACAACAGFCGQCSMNANNCTACPIGSPVLYNNFCLATCPFGSYQSANNLCSSCTSPCGGCSGGPTRCTTCTPGTPFLYNNWCYISCPAGSYQSSSSTCQTCMDPCLTCSGPYMCTSCKGGYESEGFQCKKKKSFIVIAAGLTFAGVAIIFVGGWAIKTFLAKRAMMRGGANMSGMKPINQSE